MKTGRCNPATGSVVPLLSVIIPVYNGERYLAEALESVLAQGDPALEVLVVDDGSTDGTEAVARSFGAPVRHIAQAQAGAGAARNRGATLAQGALLAFLDADDRWRPGKLARQRATFAADPDLQIVFGHVRPFICPTLPEEKKARLHGPPEPLPGFHPGTMMIRREAFFHAGPFDTQWQAGEFIDWYARAVERGLKMHMLPEVVMERRLHDTNQGVYGRDHYRRDYLRILRATLARRRTQEET